MPEYLIRVTQTQVLLDSADIALQAETPDGAAQIVLDATNGDPDDENGTRAHRLPDERRFELDPERVVGGETYAEVIVDGNVIKTVGRKPLRFDNDEHDALRILLNEAIMDTGSNRKAELFTSVLRKLDTERASC